MAWKQSYAFEMVSISFNNMPMMMTYRLSVVPYLKVLKIKQGERFELSNRSQQPHWSHVHRHTNNNRPFIGVVHELLNVHPMIVQEEISRLQPRDTCDVV